ncbi:butyrophilin-like protein 8 [Gambusia affinis]|uniref:butyrophilin-like protein 8 n=1 Tax=Gambusia affinis TaxID=33528 RepID=UPI001CDD8908|nr:butyrophilin-like protein 8 [Gambusia affinis]
MKNFVCLWFVLGFVDQSLCEDPVTITAEPGQNVTLTCRSHRNSIVTAVRLTRDNLDPQYVFLYRDEQIDKELQNPQYLGRTELQSVPTSDGNVNLTIKNVTEKDSGKYECRVKTEIKSNTRRKRSDFENTIIQLHVAAGPQGNQNGGNQDGLGVSRSPVVLMVALAAVVSVIVAMVIKTVIRRKKIKTLSASFPEDAEKPPLI